MRVPLERGYVRLWGTDWVGVPTVWLLWRLGLWCLALLVEGSGSIHLSMDVTAAACPGCRPRASQYPTWDQRRMGMGVGVGVPVFNGGRRGQAIPAVPRVPLLARLRVQVVELLRRPVAKGGHPTE